MLLASLSSRARARLHMGETKWERLSAPEDGDLKLATRVLRTGLDGSPSARYCVTATATEKRWQPRPSQKLCSKPGEFHPSLIWHAPRTQFPRRILQPCFVPWSPATTNSLGKCSAKREGNWPRL